MIYELINPSDLYTLVAPDFKIAVIVALNLGSGNYGLKDENGEQVMPIMLDDKSATEWTEGTFGCTLTDLFEGVDWEAVAACLRSVAIVPIKYRDIYDRALAAMPEDERTAYAARWHDQRRTSMNDIGKRAASYVSFAREKAKAQS